MSSLTTSRIRRMAAAVAVTGVAATALTLGPVATGEAAASSKIRTRDAAQAQQLRERIATIAKAQKGDRYVLGATGPGAFDCSGLVVYSYKKATGKTLPRTSYAQASAIEHVQPKHRKVGDIVFFRGNGHVGVYLGQGRIAQALNPGTGVVVQSTSEGWNRRMIYGYGRVIITK